MSSYAANPDNAPEWYVNIKSVKWETPKPPVIGSRVAFVANFLGRKLRYTYEIMELIPKQKLVMRTTQCPFPMETIYTWTIINSQSTKMTLQNQGNPTGLFTLFSLCIAAMMRKANTKDLINIKKIIESK